MKDYAYPSSSTLIVPTNKQRRLFEIAKQLSRKSSYKYRVGAVVVRSGKPIGFGFNKPQKTHPKSSNEFRTIHAELDAMIGLSREEISGADLYIFREHKDGHIALARPCDHCLALIREYGIRRIYYTIDNGFELEAIK